MRAPRCGSTNPEHRARGCVECRRVYNREYKSGKRFDRVPFGMPPATCSFCSIVAGNSAGVKVLRYPLTRHTKKNGKHTSHSIGSIALCDRCILEHGKIHDRYRPEPGRAIV